MSKGSRRCRSCGGCQRDRRHSIGRDGRQRKRRTAERPISNTVQDGSRLRLVKKRNEASSTRFSHCGVDTRHAAGSRLDRMKVIVIASSDMDASGIHSSNKLHPDITASEAGDSFRGKEAKLLVSSSRCLEVRLACFSRPTNSFFKVCPILLRSISLKIS